MITAGIDEVGRGCWAGPLVAGAVILAGPIPGLADSKKLSKKQREKLAAEIEVEALAIGIGWVTAQELDESGMTWAVATAMKRALAEIRVEFDEVIIDGNINYLSEDIRTQAVIKADATIPAVSAASIVAKVARDKYMSTLGSAYAGYEFEKHVGYGTAAHVAALQKLGICDLHRRSFKPIKALSQG